MLGGADSHLMLLDLIGKDYTGKDADAAGEAYITVNKNAVPPFVLSWPAIGHAGHYDAWLWH